MVKDFNEYKTKLPFPIKTEFTTLYAYKNGRVVWEGPLAQWQLINEVEKPEHKAVERFVDEGAYKNARSAFNIDQQKLIAEFQSDLEEEFMVVGNPKADKLFGLAWQNGHASGFSDVYNQYDDMVELIK